MLSCCQRGERRTLANNQRDRYRHVSWLYNKPYISPTPCMNNIQSNSMKCHDLTPKKREGTDGGAEEKHSLKGALEGVATLDLLVHANRVTDVLSPCPAWNVPKASLRLQWSDCTLLCVWVCARESTCPINHWNPPRESLTNIQHSRLVPESRIWAKWLNEPSNSCWTAKQSRGSTEDSAEKDWGNTKCSVAAGMPEWVGLHFRYKVEIVYWPYCLFFEGALERDLGKTKYTKPPER